MLFYKDSISISNFRNSDTILYIFNYKINVEIAN